MTKLYGVSGCVIICVVSCCVIICVVSCFVNKNSFRVQLIISYDQTMRTGQQSIALFASLLLVLLLLLIDI